MYSMSSNHSCHNTLDLFPNMAGEKTIGNNANAHFPNVIGETDCTHTAISSPSFEEHYLQEAVTQTGSWVF